MGAHPDRYHAFLLRIWQVRDDDKEIWRASLEDSRSGEKLGFASLEALLDYLWKLITGKEDKES